MFHQASASGSNCHDLLATLHFFSVEAHTIDTMNTLGAIAPWAPLWGALVAAHSELPVSSNADKV
jgi:hypothetical protein